MLYNLLFPLADQFQFFNLFQYITFRTGGAIITALIICFWIGPRMIDWLRTKQGKGQPIRTDGPETHFAKQGTPTMGGLMILLAVIVSTILWADLSNPFVWQALMVLAGFGAIGFADDFLKLTKRSSAGLAGRLKIAFQVLIGLAAVIGIVSTMPADVSTSIALPFFKNFLIDLGWFFIPFALVVLIGASNAVNLTDG